jgi:hypothetical protein
MALSCVYLHLSQQCCGVPMRTTAQGATRMCRIAGVGSHLRPWEGRTFVQHRIKPSAAGRHRRTVPLHGHRAPSGNLFGERGRYAVLTATLVAGVGVAGVSAATAGAAPSHPTVPAGETRNAALPAASTRTALPPDTTPAAATPSSGTQGAGTEDLVSPMASKIPAAVRGVSARRSGALLRAQQKPRPRPIAPAVVGRWVNPLPEATVTSCFGQRWGRLHAGVDLAAPDGTRIMSAGAGVIVRAGVESGYGNAVLVDHGDGYLTHYGHMSVLAVTPGQPVAAGEQLGNEGSTGHSTGPHLHFEVHQGTYGNRIEPTGWLRAHGVTITGCPTPG